MRKLIINCTSKTVISITHNCGQKFDYKKSKIKTMTKRPFNCEEAW